MRKFGYRPFVNYMDQTDQLHPFSAGLSAEKIQI